MIRMLLLALFIFLGSGCSSIPMKDGQLVVGKDTTAGIHDFGVAKVTKGF